MKVSSSKIFVLNFPPENVTLFFFSPGGKKNPRRFFDDTSVSLEISQRELGLRDGTADFRISVRT